MMADCLQLHLTSFLFFSNMGNFQNKCISQKSFLATTVSKQLFNDRGIYLKQKYYTLDMIVQPGWNTFFLFIFLRHIYMIA